MYLLINLTLTTINAYRIFKDRKMFAEVIAIFPKVINNNTCRLRFTASHIALLDWDWRQLWQVILKKTCNCQTYMHDNVLVPCTIYIWAHTCILCRSFVQICVAIDIVKDVCTYRRKYHHNDNESLYIHALHYQQHNINITSL